MSHFDCGTVSDSDTCTYTVCVWFVGKQCSLFLCHKGKKQSEKGSALLICYYSSQRISWIRKKKHELVSFVIHLRSHCSVSFRPGLWLNSQFSHDSSFCGTGAGCCALKSWKSRISCSVDWLMLCRALTWWLGKVEAQFRFQMTKIFFPSIRVVHSWGNVSHEGVEM